MCIYIYIYIYPILCGSDGDFGGGLRPEQGLVLGFMGWSFS